MCEDGWTFKLMDLGWISMVRSSEESIWVTGVTEWGSTEFVRQRGWIVKTMIDGRGYTSPKLLLCSP